MGVEPKCPILNYDIATKDGLAGGGSVLRLQTDEHLANQFTFYVSGASNLTIEPFLMGSFFANLGVQEVHNTN